MIEQRSQSVDVTALTEYLAVQPDVTAAYLFGSRVTGRARAESDVDVAVLLNEEDNVARREREAMEEEGGDVMPSPEVSIVMPCLNEEKSIGICIEKARTACEKYGIDAEIVVSDNGSTDKSVEIAQSLGARVVHQPEKGYGHAYMKGFAEARGKYIVMGDSDNTYDFSEIDRLLEPLRNGYDLVMGSRFKGRILRGARSDIHLQISLCRGWPS